MIYKNLLGRRFGKLTVIGKAKSAHGNVFWLVQCDCGSPLKTVRASNLRDGGTASCGCSYKKPFGQSSRNETLRHYKQCAMRRGFTWGLTDNEFSTLTQYNCHYCDCAPSNCKRSRCGRGDYIYNGIDRVDSTKDYTPDNVVPCCTDCNRAKGTKTREEFLVWLQKIVYHQVEIGTFTPITRNQTLAAASR